MGGKRLINNTHLGFGVKGYQTVKGVGCGILMGFGRFGPKVGSRIGFAFNIRVHLIL